MTKFTGLSAFPLTPLADDQVDEASFARLIDRLAASGVDSINALGSTGSYAYLTADERARVACLAVEHAGSTPVFVGVGALRTSHVLANIDSAEESGAAGVLLAPMTYQPLTHDDVFELFRAATERTDLPVIVYDNPGTTHFTFTTDLYSRIAELPGIASIKIPGVPADPAAAHEHVAAIRAVVPEHVTIGVSGDAFAAGGLNSGCDAWYSVIGGILPQPAVDITRAAQAGHIERARRLSDELTPLWELFAAHGSLRVVGVIAHLLGLTAPRNLPTPILGLDHTAHDTVRAALHRIGVDV